MLLIFSEKKDITTTKVAEWLNHFDIPILGVDDNRKFMQLDDIQSYKCIHFIYKQLKDLTLFNISQIIINEQYSKKKTLNSLIFYSDFL